jgi:hypothetical protein
MEILKYERVLMTKEELNKIVLAFGLMALTTTFLIIKLV